MTLFSLLERFYREVPSSPPSNSWLDEQRDDIGSMLAYRGLHVTADLLGMGYARLRDWAEGQGLSMRSRGLLAVDMCQLLGLGNHGVKHD